MVCANAWAGPVAPRPIFVLNSLDATVSVLDPTSFAEVKRIPVGKEPHHLYLTPDEKSLLVANAVGDTLTFIDPVTAEVQRSLGGIVDPYQPALFAGHEVVRHLWPIGSTTSISIAGSQRTRPSR